MSRCVQTIDRYCMYVCFLHHFLLSFAPDYLMKLVERLPRVCKAVTCVATLKNLKSEIYLCVIS